MKPDLYIAAMGRSGSTMIANWLTYESEQYMFIEPLFFDGMTSRAFLKQCQSLGFAITQDDWDAEHPSWQARFSRLIAPHIENAKWGFKEVRTKYHLQALAELSPNHTVILVRSIEDVFYSLLEKHRAQNREDKYSPDWSYAYCMREAAGLVQLANDNQTAHILRYEDFIKSETARKNLSKKVSWQGNGNLARNFKAYGRGEEAKRHNSTVTNRKRLLTERGLSEDEIKRGQELKEACKTYQTQFNYS